ncbi:hypothetical protein [Methylosinus sp. Sm6]|uniref:hypothetical protein n=1 Tax=Methylosinus sp. Sm6 TaxID=2866948 RepID=UPI001C98F202|nr:hypothetical protein [Methylosinus sp. Sm6]MBY6241201.1 hypothetical protein [Methylosinus sp. Sm6]
MALTAEDIKEGKCYATGGSERYKVIAINPRGIVTFLTFEANKKPSPLRANAGMKAFLEGVTREIPCPPES